MAKLLEVKVFSCPILRKRSQELKTEDLQKKEIQQLILDMDKTMKEKDGAGLAAPQIGHNLRLVVINTQDGTMALINPKILKKSWKKDVMEEGCLSLPQVFGLVKRSVKLRLTALNNEGKKVEFAVEGMLARVLQHEIDHLDGILFIDRAHKIVEGKDILEREMK